MWLRYVTDAVIENNNVHDAVYAGIMAISWTGGRISGNTVSRIGVYGAEANGNNAYGIAVTDQGDPRSWMSLSRATPSSTSLRGTASTPTAGCGSRSAPTPFASARGACSSRPRTATWRLTSLWRTTRS